LDFFVTFFFDGAIFSTGAVRGATVVAVAVPSVAAGASATAAMLPGTLVVELALGSFPAPSADRLLTVSDRFSAEDGAFACVARAGVLAPADTVSIGRTNVRAATEGSVG
jgi:hypothetical protein